ncbi:uncharacterized protein LOC111632184 [Centruroides sculpturatus]|uniref:uncharacterized protein LOC111632184 n=1 Tax=Centruroides sculpturatus TaxID=218467 RepID=UPI000C6DA542|nr:uncharacterized protein LOC111632184 [Centruroides sculpturatus]
MGSHVDFGNSVLIELPRFSGPYFRKDFVTALRDIIETKDIIGIGPLQFKSKWIITLKTKKVRDAILNLEEIEVSGSKGKIKPVIDEIIEGKIHWLPLEIPDIYIQKVLEKFAESLEISRELSIEEGLEHIFNGKRIIKFKLKKGMQLDMIPHTVSICNFNVLIVLKNRPPRCLRCGENGHIKKRCTAPFCTKCKSFRHDTISCTGPTYATRLRGGLTNNKDDTQNCQKQVEGTNKREETNEKGGECTAEVSNKREETNEGCSECPAEVSKQQEANEQSKINEYITSQNKRKTRRNTKNANAQQKQKEPDTNEGSETDTNSNENKERNIPGKKKKTQLEQTKRTKDSNTKSEPSKEGDEKSITKKECEKTWYMEETDTDEN